jgi:septum formation protein
MAGLGGVGLPGSVPMRRIILASASPGRRKLLEGIGLEFEVEPSSRPEHMLSGLKPRELAKSLSFDKAAAVAARHRDAVIIAADSFVVFKGEVIGKSKTAAEAKSTLARLSGRSHSLVTGFTIIDSAAGKTLSKSVETRVHIRKLSPEEIDAYVSSGEPLDKAGAYEIQGLGSVIIDRIEGDFSNVVGLPLSALAEGLKEFGVRVL